MKIKVIAFVLSLFLTGSLYAQEKYSFVFADKLEWKDAPPSMPKGAKISVIEGDMKEGPFTARLKFPPNFKVPPHWHPSVEHVTVIKGNIYFGTGDTFNPDNATKLSKGDFEWQAVKHTHYVFTKGGETIIQIHGIAPFGINYVNAADDPRNNVQK